MKVVVNLFDLICVCVLGGFFVLWILAAIVDEIRKSVRKRKQARIDEAHKEKKNG